MSLSIRERFDLATLVAAGVASTAFFLLPLLPPRDRSTTAPASPETPRLVTASVDATVASPVSTPTPRPRVTTRVARARRPAPEFVRVTDVKPPQSKLSRFLIGDGSIQPQPFPLALRRSER